MNEPYSRVKEKARYMLDGTDQDGYKEGYYILWRAMLKLIDRCPQQSLDALCEVIGE